MIKTIILTTLYLLINNSIILKFKSRRLKKINYENYDFLNLYFENNEDLKKIIFSKQYFLKKYYDEKSINYHTFAWLNTAKKIGGPKLISLSKKHIINWHNKKYSNYSFVWNEIFIAKRLLNLIYNFDYYAVTNATLDFLCI